MRDRRDEFGDAQIVVVLPTRQRNLRGYGGRFDIPFTLVADVERSVYGAYGLDGVGGDFVIDAEGRTAFAHYSMQSGDFPSIDDVIAAAQ